MPIVLKKTSKELQVKTDKLPFSEVAAFPKLFLDYIDRNQNTNNFYGNFPDLEGFGKQIAEKKFVHRAELVAALEKQYSAIENKPDLAVLGQENTFTVTTGHQLNIFTGPLYVIYKIVSTINLAKRLKEGFPQYNFVPVYWMATEDHDFEEIASFNLFGQKHTWETAQKGAVGEMDPSGILQIFDQLKEKPELFHKAYSENGTLADAVRFYMNELFGSQGLVCVDGNDSGLKKLAAPIFSDELKNRSTKKSLDENTIELEKAGYKLQIHARDINLFYLDKGFRERIELENGAYKVLNSDLVFSEAEMLNLLDTHPEKISPNVSLRPLYQETILPNLAYLGGPAELCYWFQLKGLFEHHNLAYPIVMPRNMALVINGANVKRMEKLGVSAAELFIDDAVFKKQFVGRNSENTLSLDIEKENVLAVFDAILAKSIEVDPTLAGAVEAEKSKQIKSIENLESRIKKAEERKFEVSLNQLAGLKDKLFPGGNQQERKENFLNFYLNDPQFIEKISEVFDPLDLRFNVVYV